MHKNHCAVCDDDVYVTKFSKHLQDKHNLSVKDYYDRYLKKPGEGKCFLVCGRDTWFYSLVRGYSPCCSKSCGGHIGQKKRYENPEERKLNSE